MSTQISIEDAALMLGVSPQHARSLCRKQALRAERIGSTWVVDAESVQRYQQEAEQRIAQDHPAYFETSANTDKPVALSFFSGAMGLDLGH
ncbi:hypothetical protein HORIV_04590 [Vreelandella olivaria]|uniref:Helix-turn-helix domain-containing protein n=1 Tax=Vreelandella olivaria TaxID=390919 RepID=A0ABM7GCD2_9GAMM|nr:hypothetical protein HORIV_04590 [Halomonas olivaria]